MFIFVGKCCATRAQRGVHNEMWATSRGYQCLALRHKLADYNGNTVYRQEAVLRLSNARDQPSISQNKHTLIYYCVSV